MGAAFAALPVAAAAASDAVRIDGGEEVGWESSSWYVQVDGVMGGKSTGKMEFLEDNSIMKFTGDISLDGGGFSSLRRRVDLDLSEYAGVVVTLEAVVGGGTTPPPGYHLQFGDGGSYYDFSSAFAVPLSSSDSNGPVLTSVYLPIESFDRASRSGFTCRGTCVFNPSNIDRMSVYMLFQEGGFDVRLHSIEVVEEPRSFPLPDYDGLESENDVIGLIQSTISSGGSLYDKSYVELCINMYWSVMNTILSSDSEVVSESVKAVICAGLQQVEDQVDTGDSKQNIAWTLRYAMDAVIADVQGASRTSTQSWLPTVSEASSMDVTCVGRTSLTQGFMYDPTNEFELVSESESEDDKEKSPSNSQNNKKEEEPMSGTESDEGKPSSVSEEAEKEVIPDKEKKEDAPLSNTDTEEQKPPSANLEEKEEASVAGEEEENVGESLIESDIQEEQPQVSEKEQEESVNSIENDLEQEESSISNQLDPEEPLIEEKEEEPVNSSENDVAQEESSISNQLDQEDPLVVIEEDEQTPSSSIVLEDEGLVNSTISFDEAPLEDPVEAAALESSELSSGSPTLSGYGLGTVVAGIVLLGVMQ